MRLFIGEKKENIWANNEKAEEEDSAALAVM